MALTSLFNLLIDLYQSLSTVLDINVEWQHQILLWNLLFLFFCIYVSYRQHLILSLTSIPLSLNNVVTVEEFVKRQNNGRVALVFNTCVQIYRYIVWRLLITYYVFPRLWAAKHDLLRKVSPWLYTWISVTASRQITAFSCLLFAAASLIWCVVNLPVSYCEDCIPGELQGRKMSPRQWVVRILLTQTCYIVAGSFFIVVCQYIFNDYAYEVFYASVFAGWVAALDIFVLSALFGAYCLPNLVFAPLVDGEEKIKIESLASRIKYPLGSICTMDNSTKRLFQSDVLILGWPWKRSIVLSKELFDPQSIDEVVPIVARAIGGWLYTPEYQISITIIANISKAVPILVICANWLAICRDFGFTSVRYDRSNSNWPFELKKYRSTDWPEHPIMIAILLLSGALYPATQLVDMFVHATNRLLARYADCLAAQRGYGLQLARAAIEQEMSNGVNAFEGDWLYSILFRGGRPLLYDRLEGLGGVGGDNVQEAHPTQEGI